MAARRPAHPEPRYRKGLLDALAQALAGRGEAKPGSMFGFPAFYVSGKLFACVYGDVVGLKLPAEFVAKLVARPGFSHFRPMGRPPMREWVAVQAERAMGFAQHPALVIDALEFVSTAAGKTRTGKRHLARTDRSGALSPHADRKGRRHE